jgi:hypothetical protein
MKAAKRPEWARSHSAKKRRIGDRRERTKLRAIRRRAEAAA